MVSLEKKEEMTIKINKKRLNPYNVKNGISINIRITKVTQLLKSDALDDSVDDDEAYWPGQVKPAPGQVIQLFISIEIP